MTGGRESIVSVTSGVLEMCDGVVEGRAKHSFLEGGVVRFLGRVLIKRSPCIYTSLRLAPAKGFRAFEPKNAAFGGDVNGPSARGCMGIRPMIKRAFGP